MEKVYGLTLEFQYIRNNGRILGETIFADAMVPIYERENNRGYKLVSVKAGTVLIDASLLNKGNDGRLRFTCAHELAHWVIDRDYFSRRGETAAMTLPGAKSSQCNPAIERQANRMASRILMPKCTVKKGFHEIRGNTKNAVAALAGVYEVSKQAMEIRLKELGLQ
jgi:Zn-dependent peptidase ImmA (M78 family)